MSEEIALKRAKLPLPIFERENGMKRRPSIQTNPSDYRNTEAMDSHAIGFTSLAPNIQLELPATGQGIIAIEEVTYVADLRLAYDADAMTIEELDSYGATGGTLRGFIASHHEPIRVIREDFMFPNPDIGQEAVISGAS